MDGCCLLRRCQLGHAVEKRLDGFRHPPLHGLLDYILRVFFLAVHGIDKRPVAPCIPVAFLQQGVELRIGPFNITADTQRYGIALNQLVVAVVAHRQFIIFLGIPVPADKIVGETTIRRNFARRNTIGYCLVEIANRTKRIFLSQQRSAETGLHPAARGIDLVGFGQKADRRTHIAQFQRRQSGVCKRGGIIGIIRDPAQRILQIIGIGLAAGLRNGRQLRDGRSHERSRHRQQYFESIFHKTHKGMIAHEINRSRSPARPMVARERQTPSCRPISI